MMTNFPIVHKNVNLEILTKLLDSVARKYGCSVHYMAGENRIRFDGDMNCCRHVAEETLAFFSDTRTRTTVSISCPTASAPDVEP